MSGGLVCEDAWLLCEGGYYVRVATIRGWLRCEGTVATV